MIVMTLLLVDINGIYQQERAAPLRPTTLLMVLDLKKSRGTHEFSCRMFKRTINSYHTLASHPFQIIQQGHTSVVTPQSSMEENVIAVILLKSHGTAIRTTV